MDKLPVASAKECSQRFPIKETIDTIEVNDSSLIAAYQMELAYAWSQLDSILNAGCDTQYITKINEVIKRLPAKTNTKLIIKTQENTAKIKATQDSCDAIIKAQSKYLIAYEVKLKEQTDKAKKYRKQGFMCLWLLIAVTIFAFRRQILAIVRALTIKV